MKKAEDELGESTRRLQSTDHEMTTLKTDLRDMISKIAQLETALNDARLDHERDKEFWELELSHRLEKEKLKWQEAAAAATQATPNASHSRLDLALNDNRRNGSTESLVRQQRRPKGHAGIDHSGGVLLSPTGRHSPLPPPRTPDSGTLSRHDSFATIPQTPLKDNMHDLFSARTTEHDEPYETQSFSHQTLNDKSSVTSAGAGPSIQLVERISATVRRLTSEKAATKDDMALVLAQRDEARQEIANLKKELEQKRAADERATKLESEIAQLNERYETTLELLGEKTELVEELKADIVDMKNIYRDVLNSTMK
jgi:cell division protein FtsB